MRSPGEQRPGESFSRESFWESSHFGAQASDFKRDGEYGFDSIERQGARNAREKLDFEGNVISPRLHPTGVYPVGFIII
jgi:hypothetical protein